MVSAAVVKTAAAEEAENQKVKRMTMAMRLQSWRANADQPGFGRGGVTIVL